MGLPEKKRNFSNSRRRLVKPSGPELYDGNKKSLNFQSGKTGRQSNGESLKKNNLHLPPINKTEENTKIPDFSERLEITKKIYNYREKLYNPPNTRNKTIKDEKQEADELPKISSPKIQDLPSEIDRRNSLTSVKTLQRSASVHSQDDSDNELAVRRPYQRKQFFLRDTKNLLRATIEQVVLVAIDDKKNAETWKQKALDIRDEVKKLSLKNLLEMLPLVGEPIKLYNTIKKLDKNRETLKSQIANYTYDGTITRVKQAAIENTNREKAKAVANAVVNAGMKFVPPGISHLKTAVSKGVEYANDSLAKKKFKTLKNEAESLKKEAEYVIRRFKNPAFYSLEHMEYQKKEVQNMTKKVIDMGMNLVKYSKNIRATLTNQDNERQKKQYRPEFESNQLYKFKLQHFK